MTVVVFCGRLKITYESTTFFICSYVLYVLFVKVRPSLPIVLYKGTKYIIHIVLRDISLFRKGTDFLTGRTILRYDLFLHFSFILFFNICLLSIFLNDNDHYIILRNQHTKLVVNYLFLLVSSFVTY